MRDERAAFSTGREAGMSRNESARFSFDLPRTPSAVARPRAVTRACGDAAPLQKSQGRSTRRSQPLHPTDGG